jgi:hypothetical protein
MHQIFELGYAIPSVSLLSMEFKLRTRKIIHTVLKNSLSINLFISYYNDHEK